jgi:hypothetical protein
MAAFHSERTFYGRVDRVDLVAKDVVEHFRARGFVVAADVSALDAWDISIHKGGTLRAIAGLKMALKVLLVPEPQRLVATAGVGIFGRQVAPGVFGVAGIKAALVAAGASSAALLALPLVVAQVWGLIRQSKLDDEAMMVVARSVARIAPEAAYAIAPAPVPDVPSPDYPAATAATAAIACIRCHAAISATARFCGECGHPQS